MNLWKIFTRQNAQSARNMESLPLVTIFRRWKNFLSMFQIFSYIYKNINLPKYPQSAHHHIHFLFNFQIFNIFLKMWICRNILSLFITISIFYFNPRFLKILLKIWICPNISILLITISIFYSSSRFLKIFRKIRICPSLHSLLITIWKSLTNKRVDVVDSPQLSIVVPSLNAQWWSSCVKFHGKKKRLLPPLLLLREKWR